MDCTWRSASASAHPSFDSVGLAAGVSLMSALTDTGRVMSRDWKYVTIAERTLTVGLVCEPLRRAVR